MFPTLNISPSTNNNKVSELSTPIIIGFYSLDGNRRVRLDTSRLKYIRNCAHRQVHFPLHWGYADTVILKNVNNKLDYLLTFLLSQEARLSWRYVGVRVQDSPVFCSRGGLIAVACAPYVRDDSWKMMVTITRGRIYLGWVYSQQDNNNCYNNKSLYQIRSTSWGYKFEQFMTSDDPHTEPDPLAVLNENEEFNVIQHARLGDHTLVYRSEIDGLACDSDTVPLDTDDFEGVLRYLNRAELVELKTCPITNNSNKVYQERRSVKWWIQCHLTGINTLMCGFKDREGVVKTLEKITTSDLINMSKEWSPQGCMGFLDSFLSYVKRCLEEEIRRKHPDCSDLQRLPLVSLLLERAPNSCVVAVTAGDCHPDDTILPQHFIDQFGISYNNNNN